MTVTADEMREMQWVKPELVAQIRFVEWTAEGRLRHAAFLGLRADKSAREVRRE
jgi:bifunctional non-homologous end joining protein LigD